MSGGNEDGDDTQQSTRLNEEAKQHRRMDQPFLIVTTSLVAFSMACYLLWGLSLLFIGITTAQYPPPTPYQLVMVSYLLHPMPRHPRPRCPNATFDTNTALPEDSIRTILDHDPDASS